MTIHENPQGQTAVYVLTCRASSAARVAKAAEQMRLPVFSGCTVGFLEGPIGSDPVVAPLHARVKAWFLCKRPPTANEMACYISHRKAWQALLDSPYDQALVLEDDFLLRDGDAVRGAIEAAPALLSEGRDIIKLFDYPRDRSRTAGIERIVNGIRLVKWQRTRAGFVAYLISRDGARKMLARQRIFRVVDEDIKYHWELGLDLWTIPGNSITDHTDVLDDSLLEQGRLDSRRGTYLLRLVKGLFLNIHRDILTRHHFRKELRRHGLTAAQDIA